jgi:hypothetical protein
MPRNKLQVWVAMACKLCARAAAGAGGECVLDVVLVQRGAAAARLFAADRDGVAVGKQGAGPMLKGYHWRP